MTEPTADPVPAAEPVPTELRAAVGLILVEAAAVGLLGGYLLYADLTGAASDLGAALVLTATALLVAVGLAALARALWRRRAGARGPAIMFQLLLLPVGYYMIRGDLGWLGVPLIGLALAVGALLISPASTRALGLH